MNAKTNPDPLSPQGLQLVRKSIADYRESIATLEAVLSISILMGEGFAIIAHEPDGNERALVRGTPAQYGFKYDPNGVQMFASVAVLGDRFVGLCLYSPESADRMLAKLTPEAFDPPMPKGTTFARKHIRTLQTERLANVRTMLETMQTIARDQRIEVSA